MYSIKSKRPLEVDKARGCNHSTMDP